ncbi:hypothetical protein GIS00_05820 [Nakamurella sp. YIM 132087]|uniref:Uncharacterized protein n=1 Tax=Nakamurella alba TaxID=2665158 RepID=A0A7K1FH65_9ACTN|nr:hypothetical protein [Nakamurella alba]MTD13462.1 hypothetical protein [Nakamurella alba]
MTVPQGRRLTGSELALLQHLLLPRFLGASTLREQIPSARVTGRCTCGCPSIDILTTGGESAAIPDGLLPVEGAARLNGPVGDPDDQILLFVQDGRLSAMEYVWNGDAPPRDWPSTDQITVILRT